MWMNQHIELILEETVVAAKHIPTGSSYSISAQSPPSPVLLAFELARVDYQ